MIDLEYLDGISQNMNEAFREQVTALTSPVGFVLCLCFRTTHEQTLLSVALLLVILLFKCHGDFHYQTNTLH